VKVVFVGDIHGQVELVEAALAQSGRRIFVGDMVDSFVCSPLDARRCMELVLGAVEAGEAEVIWGNHELSYLFPHHRCSGRNAATHLFMQDLRPRITAAFKSHIMLAPDFLVTHAGLTHQLWEDQHLTLDVLDHVLCDWWPDLRSPAHWIGRCRGGSDSCGGTFWCDFNREFEPVPGLRQVFGHTRGKGIRQVEQSYCIDCLEDASPGFLVLDV